MDPQIPPNLRKDRIAQVRRASRRWEHSVGGLSLDTQSTSLSLGWLSEVEPPWWGCEGRVSSRKTCMCLVVSTMLDLDQPIWYVPSTHGYSDRCCGYSDNGPSSQSIKFSWTPHALRASCNVQILKFRYMAHLRAARELSSPLHFSLRLRNEAEIPSCSCWWGTTSLVRVLIR